MTRKLLEKIIVSLLQGAARTVFSRPRYPTKRVIEATPKKPPPKIVKDHLTDNTVDLVVESSYGKLWLGLFLGSTVGFAAGIAAFTLLSSPATSERTSSDLEASEDLTLGTGFIEHRRVEKGFVASFNAATRNPAWVAELYTRESLTATPGVVRDGLEFKEEDSLQPTERARLSSYAGSGYDRGHMAPAAAHRTSPASLAATFSLSNVAPQHPTLNREYWARLEKWSRELVGRHGIDKLHVISGPLFLPKPTPISSGLSSSGVGHTPETAWEYRYPALGDPLQWVAVPTHFFKVLVGCRGDDGNGGLYLAAFVLPNQAVSASAPLEQFSVPITLLETVSGIRFLPKLLSPSEKGSADEQWYSNAASKRLGHLSFLGKQQQSSQLISPPSQGSLKASSSKSSTKKEKSGSASTRFLCLEGDMCALPGGV